MATRKTTRSTRTRKSASTETPVIVYAPRQRDEKGYSNKHRVYVEYHRRLYSDDPSTATDIDGIARAANATGVKTTTIKSWISDWRSANPRGIPRTVRENPLHVAVVGDDAKARRAALAKYES